MNRTSRIHQHRRVVMLVLALLIGGLMSLLQSATTSAHNLQTRMVYMFFDPATQACLDARIESTPLPPGCAPLPGGWMPGDPILLPNDELGVIIKVVPRDGTSTGVGGHIDFYVPNGVEVVDVAYVVPDGSGDFTKVAMKGQSPIAIGAGPIGPKTTAQLIGLNDVYSSAASGLSSTAVNPATGLHWGTIAGVYGDTGIFYATDPDTAYGSWQAFTGDSTANGCGSLAFNPTALGKTLVNNSGDTVIPCNKWDAGQLMAWGVKGGTYGQSAPIVDYGDGRGNAPWGFANGVAGPQSGYAWEFDWDEWNASAKNAAAMRAAMSNDSIGPWKRIQYNGDRVSYDQPALLSTVLGFANIDAGNQGVPVSALPATTSQSDGTSPKAIRWAVGQLTEFRPEYAYVKIKVDNPLAGIINPSGCADLRADTFGGDAGGTDNGKDHLWRYYEPTEVKLNMCLTAGKPATEEFVTSGQVFQYPIKVYNLQDFALTNVVVKDFLGSGLTFLSSVPAQNSGPNPLIYNVGTLLPGQKFEALVTVRASSSGFLDNCIEISSTQLPTQKACDTTISGPNPFLVPSKTARSSAVAPGGTVIYDVLVRNIGAGPTGNPVTIRDYLPTGFTYDATFTPVVYINGALITPTVNATNPSEPVFTIPAALLADKQITIAFRAKVSPAAAPGLYCNSYSVTQNGVPITTGSEACVSVAGGKIGDFIWRDWDGDGVQDAGEEGISGVTVKLYASDGTTLLAMTTTDANGNYYFNGLNAGTYVVEVNNGAALPGTVQTGDPDSACPGANCNNRHTVTLATDQQYLTADFGYKPTGAGSIGDKVFEDIGNDGEFTIGTDPGIPNVTVWLYEDSNNDGLIDAGDALVATTSSNGSGDYLFSGLATGFNYLVKVNKNDPDLQTYFNNLYNPDPVPYQLSTLEITSSPNLTGADLDNDFGFWRVLPGSIGDQVFIDNNGNNIYDAGDLPIGNITVNLFRDGVLIASTVSAPNGTYLFSNLGPGIYDVEVDIADPDIPGGYFPTIIEFAVPLAAGQNFLTADFPFVSVLGKTVDLAYATPGQTLNFTLKPFYPGSEMMTDVRVIDPIPAGTTYVGGSANAGGTFGPYATVAGQPGEDPQAAIGMGIYNNNNDTFRYRTFNTDADDTFSAELNGAAMGTRIQMMAGASSPTTAERVITFMDGNRHVYAARWDGSTWAAVPVPPANSAPGRMTASGLTPNSNTFWGSAVNYEQNSGHLLMVWNNDSSAGPGVTDQLAFVTREGGVWGTPANIATANQPQNLRMAARPNSDQLALVYSTANGSDYAMIWSGTAWGSIQTLDTSGGALTSVNVAYEAQSGRAMVVYGKPTATSTSLFYRIWDGSSWSAEASITPPAGTASQPQWVSIAADPFSNRIGLGVVTGGTRTWLAVWNGTSWVNVQEATATSLINTAQNVAVSFETLSGDLLAAYGVSGSPIVRYRTWTWNPVTSTGSWSAQADGPTASNGNPNVITLTRSPSTDRVMMSLNTSSSRANYVFWDGDIWDGTVTEASGNTQTATQQPMIFLWNRSSATESTMTSVTATPIAAAVGGSITVKLDLKSISTIANVTPILSVDGGSATCNTADTVPATVTGGVLKTFTYTCVPSTQGEYRFTGEAMASGGYEFPSALSNSVLVSQDGSTNIVTWNIGSSQEGVGGEIVDSGVPAGVYGFRGDGTTTFRRYGTLSGVWVDRANALGNIKKGGALTSDGVNTIYALRGDGKQFFDSYNSVTNTWTNLTNTGANVGEGGALVYLEVGGVKYVYALMGNGTGFRRYNVTGDSWTTLAATPNNVKKGGALTTDGTYIYALRGDRKNSFWRCNATTTGSAGSCDTSWTVMANVPANVGWGGGLTRIGNFIYATRGDGKTNFYRYNILANTWTSMASTPGNVRDGGALTTNGTNIYAFQGKTTGFWLYNVSTNVWTTLSAFSANTDQGGALTYLPPVNPQGRTTSITAQPILVSSGNTVQVTMVVASSEAIGTVTPGALTQTATGGASAVCGSPSPASQAIAANSQVTFTWNCTVTPGATPGSLKFTSSAGGTSPTRTFPSATSNSVLVSPVLTFQVTVNNPAPTSGVINNTGLMLKSGPLPNSFTSNTTQTFTSASIGDYVWADLDGDGLQDGNETGIPGVRVYVDSNNNNMWDSGEPYDITDALGAYRIGNLPAGNYTVRSDPTTWPAGYLPTTPTTLAVSLIAGQQYNLADFGLKPPGTGSIGDTVWLDKDNDGVLDGDEVGLPNITVNLEILVNAVWIPVASTVTDANGVYTFNGLIADDYRVTVDQNSTVSSPYAPGSFTLGAAMDPTYDKDGLGTPNVTQVTLATDSTVFTDIDFGYNWAGSIGDYVWWDYNADGLQNDGAPSAVGIQDAAVLLYFDANNNGILDPANGDYQINTALTNSNGGYLFSNLPPGRYLVDVYEDSITVGGIRDIVPTTANVVYKNLGAGENYLAADFGYFEGARVEGNVFHDDDRNGLFESGENGLANITVTLTGTDMFNNPISRTTTTDANGHFVFIVPEGDYTLTYNTTQTTTAGFPDATTPTTLSFHAYPGEDWHPVLDFGVDYGGSIGDFVWNDANGDGDQDLGEPGIPGVTLSLYMDTDGNPATTGDQTFLGATATDSFGKYVFPGLNNTTGAQKYVVKVNPATLPAGFTPTGEGQPGTPCGGGCDNQIATALTGGATITNVDFGYKPPVNTWPISGTVWNDNGAGGGGAGNGIKDGTEPGIPGVTVCLYDSTGTTVITCVVTDANGNYTFPGNPNGNYVIKVDTTTLPSNAFYQTGDPDSVCPGAGCNNQTPVTVAGAPVTNKNFGYLEDLGSISGTVCDGNGDGLCDDPGDVPYTEVVVTLRYAGDDGILNTPDDVVQNQTTVNGDYNFTGLEPGQYQITIATPANRANLADADGGNPNNITPVLSLGQDLANQDFELKREIGVIGDRVWLDEDGDGQQDAGEDGIPNAKVQLFASNGTTLLATTYTDANGNYIFPSLSAGTYVVKVDPASLPAGLAANPTYDENGTGTPHQTTVALAAGEEHDTADFGYNWAPPTDTDNGTGTGAIGDRVWVDTDGDGIQDPGEPGLGGVTVQLVTAGPDGLFGTGDDVVAASTTTNPSGNYIFDGLAPGAYVVRVPATPAGYTQTGDPDGTLDNKTTQPVALAPGDVYVNADFGYQPDGGTSGSIGDTVWLDADRDNTVDAGEPGLAGVTVALIRDLNGNGVWDAGEPIIATDTTDSAGQYLFTGLPTTDGAGTDDYIVWVNDTANVLAGLTPVYDVRDGGSQGNPATGVVTGLGISAVTNLTTTAVTNADFAYAPAGHEPGEGLIGDTIFLDRNSNNTPDPGEGLEGVTVELYASDGTTLLQTAVTNENGQYFFGDLNPTATYVVKVVTSTLPAGVTNTYDPDGGTANQSTVNLSVVGPINLLQDFGYRDTSNPNTISGTIWKDLDGDGTLEGGEPGRWAGVTVVLRDANGNVVATTTTDANGNFSFSNLPDGTYKVDVTDDNNVLGGTWKSTGPTPGADGNSQNDPYTVTVSGGQTNTTADFGYFIDSATLGNRVWSDVDGDGIQDPGEPGVAGVEVTLTIKYFGGTNVVLKTLTDANGFYSFGNLLLDEDHLSSKTGSPTVTQPVYTLTVAIPSGYTASPVNQGGNDMVDSDNHAGEDALFAQGQTNVAVNADPSLESNPNAGYDFGLDPPAAKLHLDLVKTVNNTTPSPGTNIIYTITYSSIIVNGESDTGSSLVVTDNLQLGLEYVSAIPVGAGSCSFNAAYDPPNYSGRVTCSGLPNLAPNQSGVIHLTAKVKETQGNFGFGNTIDNTAVVNGIGLVSGLPASDDGSVIVTTPVTVSYFKAEAIEGGTRFEWETATETGNAGFHLYVERNGELALINEVMVVSSAPDSSTPQSYEYEAAGVVGQVFYIEDISLFGETRMHGPFNLGEEYGARADVEAIDWAAIAAEHEAVDVQAPATAIGPQPFAPAAEGVGVTTNGADSSLSANAATFPAIEVRVNKTGIYRLTYEQILAATNVNLRGVPSKNLALTNNGVPVPIYTFKAKFGPGAYIEFLGQALDTLYTDTNVYRLEVNPALAKRVKVDTRAPSTVTPSATYMETKLIERNLDYSTLVPQGSDPWYDTWILAPQGSPQTRTFTINIDGYAGGSADTTLLLNLVGSSNYIAGPEHKVRVSLNGQFVGEDVFDDRQVRSLRISLPAGLLVNGANTLSLYLPVDMGAKADAVFIESYGVVYPRVYGATDGRITFEAAGDVFKVTNLNANKVIVYRVDGDQVTLFSKPKVVKVRGVTPATFEARVPGSATPATYYVSTVPSLLTPQIGLARVPANINSGAADLLIIAHPSFIDGFAPLVAARQAEGLTVKVVNVLDIYATYSHGVFDAEAISQYIHHAIQNLGVDYIILGGGDTLDYRNYKGNGSISFVPSLYAETLAPVSHAPADPLYADVDGDGLPDAAVGRFPVRTVAELNYMVTKTLTYGQPGATLTAVLAADKNFDGDSELLAAALTGWQQVDKAYLKYGLGTARTTLLTALNQGPRLTSFIGHSGQRNWTFDPLLLASQVVGLTNTNPTVVTQWGCWNAYYVEPTYDTFGHTFLLSGLNGAALVTGSTTLTTASAEQTLGRIMMPQLVADGMRIGDAMRVAKNQLAQTSPAASDVLLGWTILGDPTIVINQP